MSRTIERKKYYLDFYFCLLICQDVTKDFFFYTIIKNPDENYFGTLLLSFEQLNLKSLPSVLSPSLEFKKKPFLSLSLTTFE